MQVYELGLKVYVLETINHKDIYQKCAALLDKALVVNDEMAEFHRNKGFKLFTFNSLYPIELSKLYQKGKIYTLIIRTVNEHLVSYFKKELTKSYTNELKALTVTVKKIQKKHLEKIYTLTPMIQKYERGYWRGQVTLDEFENRLKINLIKKYNFFTGMKVDENFDLFTFIRFDNEVPIVCHYKGKKLLGDKLTLMIADNDLAQEIAYIALGCGIGEMNPRGYGFCNYKYA
ncbi:MAG: CRISPR-associated endoribonuclease Cas6 [Eubacterium sp.]